MSAGLFREHFGTGYRRLVYPPFTRRNQSNNNAELGFGQPLSRGLIVRIEGDEVDEFARNSWHPIAQLELLVAGSTTVTQLLGESITIVTDDDGTHSVIASTSGVALAKLEQYHILWACLGEPSGPLFEIPQVDEADRRVLHAGTVGVHVSAPRAVENFLDMAHFPYVHTDILGVEPFTEVAEYQVHIDAETNDIWATDCTFWQPLAATTSTTGQMTDYEYRVPHPYCVILYKTSPIDERKDVIALFCQPVEADRVIAHMFLCLLDGTNSNGSIRDFQQTIFAQDKPILENQHPKRLPLDPSVETPIRADRVAIAYRRWLSELGITYGVIPTS